MTLSINVKRPLLVLCTALLAAVALADVCVWRDPERTMSQIFPNAGDYKSLTRKIDAKTREKIEKRIGVDLDPSERTEWGSYKIVDKGGKELGRIIACAQSGDYGAIEVVMGVTPEGKVKGVYVQRTRERVSKQLRSRDFLAQFDGKAVRDPLKVGDDVKAIKGGENASKAVALAVKKMLVLYDELK